MNKATVALNIMLLKNCTYENWKDAISNFHKKNIIKEESDYILYKKNGNKDYPEWLKTVQSKVLNESIEKYFNKNISEGLTIIKKVDKDGKEYVFALNFGQGRHNIVKTKICDTFGIFVVQKILLEKKAKIKNTQSRNIEGAPINKKRTFAADLEENELFNILDEAEITRELGVISNEDTDFSSLIGKYGPLNIRLKLKEENSCSFAYIDDTLKKLLDIYESVCPDDLAHLFKGLQIVDKDTSEKLFNEVPSLLISEANLFSLFEPECDYDLTQISGYKYETDSIKSKLFERLTLSDYLEVRPTPSLDNLQKDKILLLDESGRLSRSWTILDALYGELIKGNEAFILSNQMWHRIITDKFERVNRKISKITEVANISKNVKEKTTEKIKQYMQSKEYKEAKDKRIPREEYFNEALSEEEGNILLDQNFIKVEGDPIEVCDVLQVSPLEFIHVKIGRNADKLSHLFGQGYGSARCYVVHPELYVTQVEEKVKAKISAFKMPQKVNTNITINYMIIDTTGKNKLTFLNKMSLIEKIENLEAFGLKVKLSWVNDICLYPKITEEFPNDKD